MGSRGCGPAARGCAVKSMFLYRGSWRLSSTARRGVTTLAILGIGLAQAACSTSSQQWDGSGATAELLGVSFLPTTHPMTGNQVGGLSGLSYDPVARSWLVVSDRAEGPIAYTLRTSFDPRPESNGQAWVAGSFEAWLGREWPVPSEATDAEGIAVMRSATGDHQRVWVYERPPMLAVEDVRRSEVRRFETPEAVLNHHRFNLGYEAVAAIPDRFGGQFWVGLESSLTIDGLESTPERGGLSRVLVYRAPTGELLSTFGYRSAPIPHDFDHGPDAAAAMNTLVGFSGLPDAGPRDPVFLLALERAFQRGYGNRAKVFALDGSTTEEDGVEFPVLNKSMVLDFATLDISPWGLEHPENTEGIAIGPEIADRRGGRLVLVVVDDNFGRNDQKQVVYAFRMHLGR